MEWTLERLVGYLKTWSYEKANQKDPLDLIYKDIEAAFGERGKITFPVLFRAGKLRHKNDQE